MRIVVDKKIAVPLITASLLFHFMFRSITRRVSCSLFLIVIVASGLY